MQEQAESLKVTGFIPAWRCLPQLSEPLRGVKVAGPGRVTESEVLRPGQHLVTEKAGRTGLESGRGGPGGC